MKKFKFILPIIIAVGIAVLPHSDECDCTRPLAGIAGIFGCSDKPSHQKSEEDKGSTLSVPPAEAALQSESDAPAPSASSGYEVIFVELGSVNCIPCRMMQPVMKAIEEKYRGRVRVVFHDVWTPEGKDYAAQYRIYAIPTQVFLDKSGKEFFRHVGFFPQAEIEKVLAKQGVR